MEGDFVTNLQLVDFCKAALKLPTLYLWGAYGRIITKSLLASKVKQYPTRYSSIRQRFILEHMNGEYRGCDCAGLIKWALWTNGDINNKIVYHSKTDRGSSGLYSAAKEKGPIAVMPELKGLILYKTGHVGVYIGNGKVIECTLGTRGDGVVESDLKAVKWTHWLKLPEIEYVLPEPGKPKKKTNNSKKIDLLEKKGYLPNKGDLLK